MSERLRGSVIESLTIAGSGAAVIIGTLLPWAYARSQEISPGQNPDELHAVNGGAFDGEATFAAGAVVIVLAVLTKYRPSMGVRLATVVLFLSAASMALGAMDLISAIPRRLPEDFLVVPGYGNGLIVTVIAAIGGSLVSLVWLIRSLRSTPI